MSLESIREAMRNSPAMPSNDDIELVLRDGTFEDVALLLALSKANGIHDRRITKRYSQMWREKQMPTKAIA